MSEHNRSPRAAHGAAHVSEFAIDATYQPTAASLCCALWAIAADTATTLLESLETGDAALHQVSTELMSHLVTLAGSTASRDLRDVKAKAMLAAALVARNNAEQALGMLDSAIRDLERMATEA